MPFVFGDSYGGVYNNLLATQQANVNTQMELRRQELAQQEMDRRTALEQQNLQDNSRKWDWTLAQDAENKRRFDVGQNLDERKFRWQQTRDNPLEEKKREFDFGTAGTLADSGQFGSPDEVKAMFPTLPPSAHEALATHSRKARTEIDAQLEPLQSAADTLNELQQLQASGSAPTDWEDTAAQAAKIMADKKLMSGLTRDQRGMWKPVGPPRPWAKPAAVGGFENVPPAEMEAIEAGHDRSIPGWTAIGNPISAARTAWRFMRGDRSGGIPAGVAPSRFRMAAGVPTATPAAVPTVGKRVKQNGVVYWFNGTDWVPE